MKRWQLFDKDGQTIAGPIEASSRANARSILTHMLGRKRLPKGSSLDRADGASLPEYRRPYVVQYVPSYTWTREALDFLAEQDVEQTMLAMIEVPWYIVRDADGKSVTGRPTLEACEQLLAEEAEAV